MDPYQLGQVLIVAPEVPFEALDRDLRACGFERDQQIAGTVLPPIVAGEPELAGWTWRGGKPFISYTFNPVVKLRVLDVGMVPPGLRGTIATRIKLLSPPEVRLSLQASDARGRLRALWAAGETERLDLIPAVSKLKEDSDGVVAKAAAEVAAKLQRIVEARVGVLANLRLLAEGAKAFIGRLNEGTYVAGLAPTRDDFAQLFDEELAGPVADAVMVEWARPPLANPGEGYEKLEVTASTAGLMRFPNELSDAFPRGYRDIAPWMVPSRVWLAWTWSNASGGAVRYDGLVWLDGRWIWLPKPFRFVGPLLMPRFSGSGETLH
jgi:hypothetical protein